MNKEPSKINILDLKDRLLLTIFGSYDTAALERLKKLRTCLNAKGYTKCRLVSDYDFPSKMRKEDNDQFFRRKSIYWLENSDACIFVFLSQVNNEGVSFEVKHVCDHLESKLSTCIVLIDSKSERYSTSLLRGSITNLVLQGKINRRFFANDEQLCSFCSSASLSFLKERRFYFGKEKNELTRAALEVNKSNQGAWLLFV